MIALKLPLNLFLVNDLLVSPVTKIGKMNDDYPNKEPLQTVNVPALTKHNHHVV